MPELGTSQTASATAVPLSLIQQLKQQGMTNNQIIQQLQMQGFTSAQIFDALSQEMASPAVAPGMAPSLNTPLPESRPMAVPMQSFASAPVAPPSFDVSSDAEELIEAIIDEKWNDLMGDINKVIAWKDATESRVTKMEQQIKDMKEQYEQLHQAVVGKIGEYDKHILDVGAEIKAMEKVFAKVLPVFTDNVAELSRITDDMKRPVKTSRK